MQVISKIRLIIIIGLIGLLVSCVRDLYNRDYYLYNRKIKFYPGNTFEIKELTDSINSEKSIKGKWIKKWNKLILNSEYNKDSIRLFKILYSFSKESDSCNFNLIQVGNLLPLSGHILLSNNNKIDTLSYISKKQKFGNINKHTDYDSLQIINKNQLLYNDKIAFSKKIQLDLSYDTITIFIDYPLSYIYLQNDTFLIKKNTLQKLPSKAHNK